MVIQDDCIKNLMDLGLTLVQAKVYYSLSKFECTTIKFISKASNLARQDVYRVMPLLEQMGLVEKIIDKPTKYKATPIKTGFSLLLQQRIVHDAELQKKTIELIKNFNDRENPSYDVDEGPQFVITSELSLLVKKLLKSSQDAKKSIYTIGNRASFDGMSAASYSYLKKALARGVQIRSITEKPADGKTENQYVRNLKRNPLYELRYISYPVSTTLILVDNKETHINISSREISSLWSNNLNIVELAKNYFEDNWARATKTNDSNFINNLLTT